MKLKDTERSASKDEIFEDKESADVTLNVWDFGGQEVYHTTHKFFFKYRCLFVLVLDVDRVNFASNRLNYWLTTVSTLVEGENVPVIIVGNKAEEQIKNETEELPFDLEECKRSFPNLNIVDFQYVSCKEDENIDEVRKLIIRQLEGIDVFRKETKRFIEDKERILATKENYILRDEFYDLFDGDKKHADQRRFEFSALGTITTFEDNRKLQRLIILRPQWITESVYKILSARYKLDHTRGITRFQTIKEILSEDDKKIEDTEVEIIINLMKNFSLCAVKTDETGDDVYYLPSFFSVNKNRTTLMGVNVFCFEYEYEILSDKIIIGFLVDVMQNSSYRPNPWRRGVYLEKGRYKEKLTKIRLQTKEVIKEEFICESKAFVEATENNEIKITVSADSFDKRNSLMREMQTIIERISKNHQISKIIKQKISVPKYPNEMLDFKELTKLQNDRKKSHYVTYLEREFAVDYLLHEVEKDELKKEIEKEKNESSKIAETVIFNSNGYGDFIMNANNNTNIGNLNTGIQIGNNITTNITTIKEKNSDVADALAKLKKAIEEHISDDFQNEALEQLNAITEEAKLPEAERKLGIVKPMLFALGTGYNQFANFASIWGTCGDIICSYFGIENPVKIR